MERFELENSREFKAAMELENALNNTCFDYKNFAESIKYFHPTLQQSLFRLIREIINVQADDSRYYDARNKASHEVAKKLVKVKRSSTATKAPKLSENSYTLPVTI